MLKAIKNEGLRAEREKLKVAIIFGLERDSCPVLFLSEIPCVCISISLYRTYEEKEDGDGCQPSKDRGGRPAGYPVLVRPPCFRTDSRSDTPAQGIRSEEHTSELQSRG